MYTKVKNDGVHFHLKSSAEIVSCSGRPGICGLAEKYRLMGFFEFVFICYFFLSVLHRCRADALIYAACGSADVVGSVGRMTRPDDLMTGESMQC